MALHLSAEQLQRFFEGLTDRMRGVRRLRSFDQEIIPVQVDLVGDGDQRLQASNHPFRAASTASSPEAAGEFERRIGNELVTKSFVFAKRQHEFMTKEVGLNCF